MLYFVFLLPHSVFCHRLAPDDTRHECINVRMFSLPSPVGEIRESSFKGFPSTYRQRQRKGRAAAIKSDATRTVLSRRRVPKSPLLWLRRLVLVIRPGLSLTTPLLLYQTCHIRAGTLLDLSALECPGKNIHTSKARY